ncbi:MAG TPA: NUDIX hydrolase [Candidatus Dormibacteraeota bacterium]
MSRWREHGRRQLYSSPWVALELADVELPDGTRFDHHVVRIAPAVMTVVVDRDRVLMLHRHRFITDRWGWELPAGRIEAGETVEAAAVRETLEETGWRPSGIRPLVAGYPVPGLSDVLHHVLVSEDAEWVGPPTDTHEADRVDWVAAAKLKALIQAGEMPDGYSQWAVLAYLSLT